MSSFHWTHTELFDTLDDMTTTQPQKDIITLDELTLLGLTPVVLGGPSLPRNERRVRRARSFQADTSADWSSARDRFSNPR